MKTRFRFPLLLVVALLLKVDFLCERAHAAAGDVDPSFYTGPGALDGPVRSLALQPDGKVIITGGFSSIRGFARPGVARIETNGEVDVAFTVDPNLGLGGFRSIRLQPDGKVLVATELGIGRLNANGSRDLTFTWPSVLDDNLSPTSVLATALQPDGKVLIGGFFTLVDGAFCQGIARLHANGNVDGSFSCALNGFFPVVESIAVQPDGKILIGGMFNGVDGATRNSISRLNADGSLDSAFDPGSGVGDFGEILAIGLQADGKVLLGGNFTAMNGADRHNLARLNPDGSLDQTFTTGSGANHQVSCFAALPDGRVVLGGHFSAIHGTSRNHIARLLADGSVDPTFDPGSEPRAEVFALAVQPDGKVLAGCADASGSGASAWLTRFLPDGSRDATLDTGSGVYAETIQLQPDGKVLFTGHCDLGTGKAIRGICRLLSDGSVDGTFNPDPLSDGFVFAMALQPDGKVLFGGHPGLIKGAYRKGIARLNADGSLDSSFNPGAGVDYAIHAIAVQPDGRILIGGYFYSVDGIDRRGLARLHADGTLDSTFLPDNLRCSPARSIVVQPDGKVLVGGDLPGSGGLVRLNANGSLGDSFQIGASPANGMGFSVQNIVLRADGRMFIAGSFQIGTYQNSVALLNANGSRDATFNPAYALSSNPGVLGAQAIHLQQDGAILVTGTYALGNGGYYQGLYRLRPDGSLDVDLDPGTLPFRVGSIAVQPDGKWLISGPQIARVFGTAMPTPFSVWAASFGLAGAAAVADADPDHDDMPNGVEYVLGENPLVSTPPVASTSTHPAVALNGGNMIFTFSRNDASETSDVTLTVESGTNLGAWPDVFKIGANTAASSPGATISENGSAPDTVTVAIPLGDQSAIFARIKVIVTP